MATFKTVYKCRECGATSYQRVFDRANGGPLAPTGQYRCTGCRNIFESIRDWWEPRTGTAATPSTDSKVVEIQTVLLKHKQQAASSS
jgi:DNA-directed RNA polymerase subunit RPC12/RpoP